MTEKHPIPDCKTPKRRFYNFLSRYYDFLAHSSEAQFIGAGLSILNALPGQTVLEIGSGTGAALLTLAKNIYPAGNVIGIDLSENMAQTAINKLKNAILNNFFISVMDANYLALKSASLDGIFSSFTIESMNQNDIHKVLDECYRCLKPYGKICLVYLYKPEKPTVMIHLYEFLHRLFPVWIDCHPVNLIRTLEEKHFCIQFSVIQKMWGLPVNIVLARKE